MVRWLVAGTEKKALRCIGIGIARVRSTCLYAYVWDMMNSETACSPRLSLSLSLSLPRSFSYALMCLVKECQN